MENSIDISENITTPKNGKTSLYAVIILSLSFLAVLQDFIYSQLYETGFYLSESALYNSFWAFFLPLTFLSNKIIKKANPENKLGYFPLNVVIGIAVSFLHLILFTAVFVLVSNLVFSPPHHFTSIFKTALSNQLYIAVLWYTFVPLLFLSKQKSQISVAKTPQKFNLKSGGKVIAIPASTIQLISADKPYSVIFTNDKKLLDQRSLKEFESMLDTSSFIRVHRSAIVNVTFVLELKSRSNGDYDVKLKNGQTVRFSRHYRNNWLHLLQ